MESAKNSIIFHDKGKPVWKKLAQELNYCFAGLHDAADAQRFGDYLASPFFVKNFKVVSGVYLKLWKYYGEGQARPVRIIDFCKTFFAKYVDTKRAPRLRKVLGMIIAQYNAFRTHEALQGNEVEYQRLQTLAFRQDLQSDRYELALKGWKEAASTLPCGPEKLWHDWAVADMNYYQFSDQSSHEQREAFAEAFARMEYLTTGLQYFYDNERFNRSKIHARELIQPVELVPDPFVESHRLLRKLHDSKGFDEQAYTNFCSEFVTNIQSFNYEHRAAFFSFIMNYLMRIKRLGYVAVHAKESLKWTWYLIENTDQFDLQVVSKAFLFNRIMIGVNHNNVTLIETLRARFLHRLPKEDQAGAEKHANVSIAFATHDYNRVLTLINDTQWERWKNTWVDDYRLKSFRLRACLCLFARGETSLGQLQQALADYEKLYSLTKNKLGTLRQMEIYRFICHTRKIVRLLTKPWSREEWHKEKSNLAGADYFHARDWLYSFMEQADKTRRPIVEKLRPLNLPACQ